MKAIWLLGLMSMLLMLAYDKVAGMPGQLSQRLDWPVAPAGPGAGEDGTALPAEISEYLFVHQTRDEILPVHAMAGVKTCPE